MDESNQASGAERGAESIYERRRREIVALIPKWYSPAFHLAFPSLVGLAVLVFAALHIHELRAIELLAIPGTILLAFGFEWRAHKMVLHRRFPLMETIYERHELQHHVIYTHDKMEIRDRRELWLVLIPAYAILLIFAIDAPLAYGLSRLFTPNVGYLFLVTSMWFFLTYEWLHFSYHLSPTSTIGRTRLIATLRELHQRHHDPRLMKSWNFNVTIPVFDWLYRTNWTPEREAERDAKLAARRLARASSRRADAR